MLLGFRDESFEVGDWKKGTFFISATVLQRSCNLKWRFMLVYGPADHNRSTEFLGELEGEITSCSLPLAVGGGGISISSEMPATRTTPTLIGLEFTISMIPSRRSL
jgi:hypothetical protein